MNTILFALGRSIPSPVPWMKRRSTTPRPFEVKDVSRKSTRPPSSTLMFSYVALACVAALDPVHGLAQHGFLRLAGVVAAEDVRVALLDVAEDEPLRPVGHVDGDEVRLEARVGREEHVVPHVRDARVLDGNEETAPQ